MPIARRRSRNCEQRGFSHVMSGLDPGIHALAGIAATKDVDGRDKHGHDELIVQLLVVTFSPVGSVP